MRFPTISEYIDALKNPMENFKNNKNLQMVLDKNGLPVFKRGKYGVVFKMTDGSHFFAVKCYLQEREGIDQRMVTLQKNLSWSFRENKYIVPFYYYTNELSVNVSDQGIANFSILTMDWIEGEPLDVYFRDHLDDPYERYSLAYRFSQLALWLRGGYHEFAHGDIKPSNILVNNDGQLVLIDYDGMYVSELKGKTALENGTEGFRLPNKTKDTFDESIDDYAIIVTLLSLLILAEKPIWMFNSPQWMAFDSIDIQNIINGIGDYENVYKLPHIQKLRELLKEIHKKGHISKYNLQDSLKIYPNLWSFQSEKYSWYSKGKTYEDPYGIIYSEDQTHLLKGSTYLRDQNKKAVLSYNINAKTRIIHNEAFSCGRYSHGDLNTIIVPSSVSIIGDNAFERCGSLNSVELSDGLKVIGEKAFYCCSGITRMQLPDSLRRIGNKAFEWCTNMLSINIPDKVLVNFSEVFERCKNLNIIISSAHLYYQQVGDIILTRDGKKLLWCNRSPKETIVHIPYGVEEICSKAFANVSGVNEIIIPTTVKVIRTKAFSESEISTINITGNIEVIEKYAFEDCKKLESVLFTSSNPIIGEGLFKKCINLKHVELSNDMRTIGNTMFEGCMDLTISAGENVKEISNNAFKDCKNIVFNIPDKNPFFVSIDGSLYTKDQTKLLRANVLKEQFEIPQSVSCIGEYAFAHSNITNVDFHSNIERIESYAFEGCKNIRGIYLPNTIKHVGSEAFCGCGELTNIILSGDAEYGYNVFGRTSVNYLFIPGSIKVLEQGMLTTCEMKILHIGEGVEKAEEYFIQNACPEKIIIPSTLNNIEDDSFAIYRPWKSNIPAIEGPKELVSKVEDCINEFTSRMDYEEAQANMMTD